jgi:predicted nucleic acid-binding protein
MGSKIIADSSALVSLGFPQDSNHKKALYFATLFLKTTTSMLIPTEVLAETLNVLGKKFGHKEAVAFAQYINFQRNFIIESSSETAIHQALDKFSNLPASASFTDCLVMATADEYETKAIFGFDEIFAQNGYSLPSA